MEIFLLVIVIFLVVYLITQLGETKRSLRNTEDSIDQIREEIGELRKHALIWTPEERPTRSLIETKETQPAEKPAIKEEPRPIILPPVIAEEKKEQPHFEKPAPQPPIIIKEEATPVKPITPPRPHEHFTYEPHESWFDKWLKNNPDIEKFIGENLINKIGIAVLVLGIGFFVKYAIDQDWIKEIGRVGIGLLCGGILIVLAHRLRKGYHAFSSVLVGGGLSVFYFTIALAFHQYSLLTQTAAFSVMVVITVFAVLLSILYNRIELAIIATVGGFITPFLVSTGQGNYIVLFTYLAILNTGLIVLAYYKRWRPLNFIAFVFTALIYLAWIFDNDGGPGFPYKGTFMYGILFYAMFIVMNVIHHVRRGSKLKAFDFIILLSVNLCFYGAGIYLLGNGNMADYKGLFTAALGLVNLFLGWLFFKRSKADKHFIYLIIGITVTYISLAAPVQLHGHYITLFWAAETVVLLWLYQKSFIRLLKIASFVLSALMLISLLIDWYSVYYISNTILPVIANKGLVTGLVCSAAMLLVYMQFKKEADTFYLPGITNNSIRALYAVLSIVLLFFAGVLEVAYQFATRFPGIGLEFVYLQLYIVSFFLILFAATYRFKISVGTTLRLVLPLLIGLMYFANTQNIYAVENRLLTSGSYHGHFLVSWLSAALLLVLAYQTIAYARKNNMLKEGSLAVFAWFITIAVVAIFSIEIRNATTWLYFTNQQSIDYAENLYGKAGLSIVWGLASFIIIWLGLSKKYKPLRIIALLLFGVTLIKLFAYDIQDIPVGGKILAFILLGVVLLVVSFMYQRLKKFIIDDKDKTI